jgi:hypothetical protein
MQSGAQFWFQFLNLGGSSGSNSFFIFKLVQLSILFSVLDLITSGFDSKIQNIKMDNGGGKKKKKNFYPKITNIITKS